MTTKGNKVVLELEALIKIRHREGNFGEAIAQAYPVKSSEEG